jgi:very-short-patch-repair endonuclease
MGGRDDTRGLAALAARQHGNLTLAQLRGLGLTRREIDVRCEAGWLIPRHTRVFALGYVPEQRESAWHAGVLALGEGAVLSYTAAAALWGMLRGGAVTEVTVPTTAGRPKRDGILVHRQRLPTTHVTTHRGIPVTTPIRTLLDLAAVASLSALFRAFEQAQVRLHMPPAPLAAEVISRPRRRGNAKLRRVLIGSVDPAEVRSVLELRFLRMCAAHGIPRPQVNVRIGIWTPDFLWPERRLIVETDGYDFHRTAAARRRDARKDEAMRGLGLTVVRLTWSDVVERPAATADRIRRHECRPCDLMGGRGDIRAARGP